MNLLGTLARVAVGAIVARGVGKMMSRQTSSSSGSGGGLGDLLGGMLGGSGQQSSQSGSSAQPSQSGGGLGGLGGLLGGLAGGAQQGGGGLGDLLGSVLSGRAPGAAQQPGGATPQSGGMGGLGGLLDSLDGDQQRGSGLGGLLNQTLSGQTAPEPTPDQNNQAEILLRAMINAAKSDGQIDNEEKQKILEHLGDVTQEEIEFVRNEMAQPLNVDQFVASVPARLQQQVYVMSLLGIRLDSQVEAQYLDRLAKGMGLSPQLVNQIHAKVGLPKLYA